MLKVGWGRFQLVFCFCHPQVGAKPALEATWGGKEALTTTSISQGLWQRTLAVTSGSTRGRLRTGDTGKVRFAYRLERALITHAYWLAKILYGVFFIAPPLDSSSLTRIPT